MRVIAIRVAPNYLLNKSPNRATYTGIGGNSRMRCVLIQLHSPASFILTYRDEEGGEEGGVILIQRLNMCIIAIKYLSNI